jgi:hypothetical protein
MTIKDHPTINWERWLRPFVRINLPSGNLDHTTVKDVRYIAHTAPYFEVTLEHGGESGTSNIAMSDPHFAQRFYHELTNNCIGKTITEIGERQAP